MTAIFLVYPIGSLLSLLDMQINIFNKFARFSANNSSNHFFLPPSVKSICEKSSSGLYLKIQQYPTDDPYKVQAKMLILQGVLYLWKENQSDKDQSH